ncbi:MAG: LysE family translocator [Desulfuromonas sp.]|nr:LysE family translocator [Desulfuromonas sp.]
MFATATLLTFITASTLLALAPGPDNLFVLTQSALHGRKAGLMITLGLCSGLVGHTLAVALGIAVLFQASALAFTALKLVGASYLLYLAWQAFRASGTRLALKSTPPLKLSRLYRRGIVMNLTNPKVSIFFLAFLPQFADPQRGNIAIQLTLLGGLFILTTVVIFGAIALLAGQLGHWFGQSPRCQQWLNRSAAMVFVALAVKLACAER